MSKLNELMARGTALLGSDYAILCGAMSWVSERHLVSAISNAGGFGVIACGAMTPELLDAEIAATKALATRNFGVNLITMHPQLFELIEVCAKHGVGHVVLAGGLPPKGSLEAIKASGAKVICFAPTLAAGGAALRWRRSCAWSPTGGKWCRGCGAASVRSARRTPRRLRWRQPSPRRRR